MNKKQLLIARAEKLSKSAQIDMDSIQSVAQNLSVIISDEFIRINSLFRYDYINQFEWCGFPEGVIFNTLDLRNQNLPSNYLVLADEGDGGMVLLETQDSPEKPSPVIWCDMEDVYNLCDEGVFKYNPTIWDSFTDFFEYLVNEEEKLQKEDVAWFKKR